MCLECLSQTRLQRPPKEAYVYWREGIWTYLDVYPDSGLSLLQIQSATMTSLPSPRASA